MEARTPAAPEHGHGSTAYPQHARVDLPNEPYVYSRTLYTGSHTPTPVTPSLPQPSLSRSKVVRHGHHELIEEAVGVLEAVQVFDEPAQSVLR